MNEVELETSLIEELHAWINQMPSKEDLLYYVKKLPEDKKPIINVAADSIISSLLITKYRYFAGQNLSIFTEKLSETDQYLYLHYFTLYSAPSVLSRLQQEHSEVVIGQIDPEINQWADTYLKKWEATLSLVTAPELLMQEIYANSFIHSQFTNDNLKEIQEELTGYLLGNAQYFEKGEDPPQAEVGKERVFLTNLQVFPEEFVISVLQVENMSEKMVLYNRIHAVLTQLIGFGKQNAIKYPKNFRDILWDLLIKESQDLLFAELDGEKLASAENFQSLEQLYTYLTKVWTVNNIESRAIESILSSYLVGLNFNQKNYLLEHLQYFLENSTILQVLFEPGESLVIVKKTIEGARVNKSLQELEELLKDVKPELLADAKYVMGVIYNLFRI